MGYNINRAIEKIDDLITYIERKNPSKAERTETELLKDILSILNTKDVLFIEWGTVDILSRAEDLKKTITQKQAQDILEEIEHRHDCNYGITWNLIDYYIMNS